MKINAWICFIYAILIGLSFCIQQYIRKPELQLINFLLSILKILSYIYILLAFKVLLNQKFCFRKLNIIIYFLIVISITVFLMGGVLKTYIAKIYEPALWVCLIVFGIIKTIFALKFLKFEYDFHGFLKPFCTICIAHVIASLIFGPLALLLLIVENVLLGLLFKNTTKEIKKNNGTFREAGKKFENNLKRG